jgi:iron(III) transport system substrate-binding protein
MKGTRMFVVLGLCLLLTISVWADEEQEKILAEVGSEVGAWLEAAKIGPFAPAEEDWEAVYEAAKKEGKVVVYSGSSKFNRSLETFKEAYPGIEIEFYKASQNDLFSKITLEQNSGIYKADIIQFGLTPQIVNEYIPYYMAWNYVPPELKDVMLEVDQEPVLIHRFNFFSVVYNPRLFDEPPIDSWWDLTRPEWKGKILTDDPYTNDKMFYNLSTFVEHSDAFAEAYEKEFGKPIELDEGIPDAAHQWIKDFLANEPIMAGPKDTANAVGGKEVTEKLLAIIVSGRFVDVATDKADFTPIIDMEPVTGLYDGLSVVIANMAPHPNAAKLVTLWIFGDEQGGKGYTPWFVPGLIPTRTDVPTPPNNPVDLDMLREKFWRYDYDWAYNNLPNMRDFWTQYIMQ